MKLSLHFVFLLVVVMAPAFLAFVEARGPMSSHIINIPDDSREWTAEEPQNESFFSGSEAEHFRAAHFDEIGEVRQMIEGIQNKLIYKIGDKQKNELYLAQLQRYNDAFQKSNLSALEVKELKERIKPIRTYLKKTKSG